MQAEILQVVTLTVGMEGFEQLQSYGFSHAWVGNIEMELERRVIFVQTTYFLS